MRRTRRLWMGLAWLYSTTLLAAAPLSLTQVADGVYVHHGAYQEISALNAGDIANIGFIVGHNCVAVIDTGGSLEVGQALRAAIKATTTTPICYVINTHVHPDHIFGNAAFVQDHPKFVGHVRLPAALAARGEYYLRSLSDTLHRPVPQEWLIPPSVVVAKRLTLDLGGRDLLLIAQPTAHTDNDLTVFDVNTDTLWLSDLLFVKRVPALDGSLRGWIDLLRRLQAQRVARVVPGHGPPSVVWPQAGDAELRYLLVLRDETRAIIRRGGTIEQAIAQVGRDEQRRWLLFDQYNTRNVTAAYAELEWE